jgi:hypothetical protein
MPSQVQTRPLSDLERTEVEKWLKQSPNSWRRMRLVPENTLVLWSAIMLAGLAVLAGLR